MGNTIQLILDDLSSYKITLSFTLYSTISEQSYTLIFNNDSSLFITSSISYEVCEKLYFDQKSDINFSDISINNKLTFTSS